jgi:hypothetical protein
LDVGPSPWRPRPMTKDVHLPSPAVWAGTLLCLGASHGPLVACINFCRFGHRARADRIGGGSGAQGACLQATTAPTGLQLDRLLRLADLSAARGKAAKLPNSPISATPASLLFRAVLARRRLCRLIRIASAARTAVSLVAALLAATANPSAIEQLPRAHSLALDELSHLSTVDSE